MEKEVKRAEELKEEAKRNPAKKVEALKAAKKAY